MVGHVITNAAFYVQSGNMDKMPCNMLLGVMPRNIHANVVVEDNNLTKMTTYGSTPPIIPNRREITGWVLLSISIPLSKIFKNSLMITLSFLKLVTPNFLSTF